MFEVFVKATVPLLVLCLMKLVLRGRLKLNFTYFFIVVFVAMYSQLSHFAVVGYWEALLQEVINFSLIPSLFLLILCFGINIVWARFVLMRLINHPTLMTVLNILKWILIIGLAVFSVRTLLLILELFNDF